MTDILEHREKYDSDCGYHYGCTCGWEPKAEENFLLAKDEYAEHMKQVVAKHDRELRDQITIDIEAALVTGTDAVCQTIVEGPLINRLKASNIAAKIARGDQNE